MLVLARIETSAPICIEKFSDYKMLGRFTLRDEGERSRGPLAVSEVLTDGAGKTVAIGKVTKLLTSDDMPNVSNLAIGNNA
jgi:peptide chain release factor subunit 3